MLAESKGVFESAAQSIGLCGQASTSSVTTTASNEQPRMLPGVSVSFSERTASKRREQLGAYHLAEEGCRKTSTVFGCAGGYHNVLDGLPYRPILDGALQVLAEQQEPYVFAGENREFCELPQTGGRRPSAVLSKPARGLRHPRQEGGS